MRRKPENKDNNALKLPIKPRFMLIAEQRSEAIESLLTSLAHLPREEQFRIICGWMPLDNLIECATFNATKTIAELKRMKEANGRNGNDAQQTGA